MSEHKEPRDYCPRCGVAYEPLQEYCLECGSRLPTNRGVIGFLAAEWQRRLAWYPGDWIWPVLLFLVITIAATAAAVALGSTKEPETTLAATKPHVTVGPGAPQPTVSTVSQTSTLPTAPAPTVSTGKLPTAPAEPTTSTPTPANPNALAEWPTGKSGYTLVLVSLPLNSGRANALARARAAKRAGLPDVGVLVSSQYSSLHPGYYVVFSGIYATQAQASSGVSNAHARGFQGAYQVSVTR
ncbi:MAG TPA: hypothetical protein VNY33_06060 [Gaiellaceae bacterium]|nr:hypothetical protein [Gaiellaceae bacterium]